MASEVVTRNLGARRDSIVTVEPDVARDEGGQDLGSVLVSTNNARSPTQNCLKPSTGASLKEPLL